MSNSYRRTYELHPMGRSIYWLTCVLALVSGITALVVSVRVVDGRWMITGLGAVFVVGGLAMFIRPRTVVESHARIVRRQLRLFGRFLISSRDYSFSDFVAVVIRHVRRSGQGDDPDSYFVSLRRRSGRPILIRYYQADSARACRPAEMLAHRLAADLQIEIDDHDA
jgi:hypothetical protein